MDKNLFPEVDKDGRPWPTWSEAYRCPVKWKILRAGMQKAAHKGAEQLFETADAFRVVTWAEVGMRHGFPDVPFTGSVISSAVRKFCFEHQRAYPYRGRVTQPVSPVSVDTDV